MFVKLSPYLIAMSIGLIIGVERERRIVGISQPMGVRSFLLFSLLGAITGGIKEPLVALVLGAFAACATLLGYVRATQIPDEHEQHIGLTTEIAAMATFGLGYFCNSEPILSLALGVVMFLVLSNKNILHTWTKERLKPNELQAAATLLLLAIGVIPILPDYAVDPLHIFNPRRLGVIISLIAAIQFLGYAAVRLFGNRMGMAFSGFLAGNISSTAVFASYPRLAKESPHNTGALASAATFAVVATLLQLLILLAVISWPLALALSWPLIILIMISAGVGVYLSPDNKKLREKEHMGNPLNLFGAIKLGTLLMTLIFIVELSQRFAGEAVTVVITFLGALFKLQGVGMATANMFENHAISLHRAALTIMLAVFASLLSKFVLTAVLASGLYRTRMLMLTGALMIMAIIIGFIIAFFPYLMFQI